MYRILNKMIGIVVLAMVVILTSACGGSSGGTSSGKDGKPRKLFILKNSSSYADIINEQIAQGIDRVSKEISNVVVEFSQPIENLDQADKYLKDFLKADPDYILACDSSYKKIIENASKEHKNVKFGILEAQYEEKLDLKGNLVNYRFRESEIGYLTAFVAVKFSESKKIAYIAGMNDSVRTAFKKGLQSGIQSSGNNVDFSAEYLGTTETAFENKDYANALARKHYSKGSDIIVHNAGAASKGIFEAAVKEQKYVIGYGVDQTYEVGEYAKKIFYTSITKKYDSAIYQAVKNFDAKVFAGGTKFIGFREDAIGYTLNNSNNKIVNIKGNIEKFIEGIKGEQYIVPDDEE